MQVGRLWCPGGSCSATRLDMQLCGNAAAADAARIALNLIEADVLLLAR